MNNLPAYFDSPHILAGYDESESILVGLSGGADSVALLHMLCQYAKGKDCKIYAAHINHNIRTEKYSNEAARDENFCRELCGELGVELFVRNIDVPRLATESGQSIEGAAREARYSFFTDIMNEKGIKILALAHNANDNLETQLFNLCRGASVGGIIGIKQVRGIDSVCGGVLVRPLLGAVKKSIIFYCNYYGLDYMTDSTNFELDATRNRIRHNVIPELEKIFDSPYFAAMRLSRSALEYEDYLTSEAKKILDGCDKKSHCVSVPLDMFCALHIALRKKLLILIFGSLFNISLESIHINSIIKLADKKIPHKRLDLPYYSKCYIEDGMLKISVGIYGHTESIFFEGALSEGLNIIENCPYMIGVFSGEKQYDVDPSYTPETFCFVKNDTINNMSARARKEGDKILDGGNHKKLKKLMCDKKIPLAFRDKLPVILRGEEIIYIPFCAVADSAKLGENDKGIMICIYKNKNEEV